MTSLLNRLFGRPRKGSGKTAKERLRFVLQHDRINLPPERMQEMKRDILAVIVKYVVVDQDRVEITLEQRDRNHSKLVAEIPVVKQTEPPSPESVKDSTEESSDASADSAVNNGNEDESTENEGEGDTAASENGEDASEKNDNDKK